MTMLPQVRYVPSKDERRDREALIGITPRHLEVLTTGETYERTGADENRRYRKILKPSKCG